MNLLTAQRASPNESNVLKIAGGWRRGGGLLRKKSDHSKRQFCKHKTVPAERMGAADLWVWGPVQHQSLLLSLRLTAKGMHMAAASRTWGENVVFHDVQLCHRYVSSCIRNWIIIQINNSIRARFITACVGTHRQTRVRAILLDYCWRCQHNFIFSKQRRFYR